VIGVCLVRTGDQCLGKVQHLFMIHRTFMNLIQIEPRCIRANNVTVIARPTFVLRRLREPRILRDGSTVSGPCHIMTDPAEPFGHVVLNTDVRGQMPGNDQIDRLRCPGSRRILWIGDFP
jgi:hypothetical protein